VSYCQQNSVPEQKRAQEGARGWDSEKGPWDYQGADREVRDDE